MLNPSNNTINRKERKTEGFALIDALIGVVIASILSAAFLSSIYQASVTSSYARDQLTASLAMLEMYEVLVALATDDYKQVYDQYENGVCSVPAPCHISLSGGWKIETGTTTSPTDNRFKYSFSLDGVNRNAAGDIDPLGENTPTTTIAVIMHAAWTTRGEPSTNTLTTYLHRINP